MRKAVRRAAGLRAEAALRMAAGRIAGGVRLKAAARMRRRTPASTCISQPPRRAPNVRSTPVVRSIARSSAPNSQTVHAQASRHSSRRPCGRAEAVWSPMLCASVSMTRSIAQVQGALDGAYVHPTADFGFGVDGAENCTRKGRANAYGRARREWQLDGRDYTY